MSEFVFLGKKTIRHDAQPKVTGVLKFTNDLEVPGMLIGRIFRSPYAFADISRVDVSEAERMGAVALTPDEVPQKLFNPRLVSVDEVTFKDHLILTKKPRYLGEPVAAVAAPSEELAQRALESIRIYVERVYEPILDPFKAMDPSSPLIHESILKGDQVLRVERNVAARLTYSEGDVDKAFKEADVVLERRFKTGKRYHMQLEPKAVYACRSRVVGLQYTRRRRLYTTRGYS